MLVFAGVNQSGLGASEVDRTSCGNLIGSLSNWMTRTTKMTRKERSWAGLR